MAWRKKPKSIDDLIAAALYEGESLEQFAARVGLTARGLWNIRQRRKVPRLSTLAALARALKVTPAELRKELGL